MKLTKKQRDEVVMLLRCAADLCGRSDFGPFCDAQGSLDIPSYSVVERAGWEALRETRVAVGDSDGNYQLALLEAAALVEEGVLP